MPKKQTYPASRRHFPKDRIDFLPEEGEVGQGLIKQRTMAKNKYYVVWKGITPGVYDNWGECKAQVDGQDGAKYKSFETKEEATKAFEKDTSII